MSALTPVRELFDRALAVPEAERRRFLCDACSDDVELRLSVERLLKAESLWSVFDSSASVTSATGCDIDGDVPRLEVGTCLGPYEVVASIDRGGMGEVYQAMDRRLDRPVAIKVLRRSTSNDSRARGRFTREARTIAALSHPNICQLFDVGDAEGTDYLVMEYLPGETLAARLRRGPMPLSEAITCALEIASGLAAAHRAGIVHRDLKPANIMLTPTGARLLDFGLARSRMSRMSVGSSHAEGGKVAEFGPFVGTLPYMAPEQLEGADADDLTDVYAFGVVLFEMLTGRRAFDGGSGAVVIAQVLDTSAPSLAARGVKAPAWLNRVIARCLARSRDARFQSVADLQAAIATARRPRVRKTPVIAALVVLLAGGATAWLLSRPEPRAPQVVATRRLTYDRTFKDFPYTDGKRVVYVEWKPSFSGTSLLQIPLAGGDTRPVPTPFGNPYLLDVTPTGDWLITDTGTGRLHAMSAEAEPRPIGNIRAGFADLSSDGRMLVLADAGRLMIAGRDGSGVRQLLAVDGRVVMPRWSPDGKRIRYTLSRLDERSLWEVSAEGSGNRLLLPGWRAACGAWTADGRHFVFEAERDGEYGLWALAEPDRWLASTPVPSKLTAGPMRYENAVPAPDGSTVLALGTPPGGVELARFDLRTKQFTPLLSGLAATDVEFSPDRTSMAYVRHADSTLWRSRSDGTDRLQLTFAPLAAMLPRWSRDGRRIAFTARPTQSQLQVFMVDAGGGTPRRISAGDFGEEDATWAPDGGRVVLTGRTSANVSRLRIVDIGSGHAETIPGSEGLFSARWSPDGHRIAALSQDLTRLTVYDLRTRTWRELLRGRIGWPTWTRDGAHIQLQDGTRAVRVRVSDGDVEPIADLALVKQARWQEAGGSWLGMAADEAPLVLQEVGVGNDIYALEITWP